MKKLSVILIAILTVLMFTVSVSAAPLVFRFAGQQAPDHPATKVMQQMAEEIKDKTNGRVDVKVYPANSLGNYSLVMEELMRGTIDMSMMSIASDFDPRVEIVYVYGYIESYEQAKKIYDPSAWFPKKLNSFLEPVGVHLLGCYLDGMIAFGSAKPVIEPLNPNVDKGVLIRSANMAVDRLGLAAMGFRPITIPWSDMYQALRTGVCDAVAGVTPTAAYTILGDALKEWHHIMTSMEYMGIMISDKSWKKLTPEEQAVFKEIAKKYTLLSIDHCKAEDEKSMKLMEKKGIKVYRYTPEQLKPLKKACQSVWSELGKRGMGEELMSEFKRELGK